MDVHLDRVIADFFSPLAQALDQLVLADEPADALQQHLEQAEFACRQVNHLTLNGGNTPCLVVHQRTVFDGAAGAAHAAPRQCAHTRFQLLQRKGLGHVIVGAVVETLDALFNAVGGRQNEHWQG